MLCICLFSKFCSNINADNSNKKSTENSHKNRKEKYLQTKKKEEKLEKELSFVIVA